MSSYRRSLAILLLLMILLRADGAAVTIPAALAPWSVGATDRIVDRTRVPREGMAVGEVRLVERGEASVIQTVLHTTVLRRVVAEIRKKELGNWPADHPEHAESVRYLDALEAARRNIWDRMPKNQRGSDLNQNLLIEFVLTDNAAGVLLAEYKPDAKGDGIASRRSIAALEMSRGYVVRNMKLIVADSFALPLEKVDERIAPLRALQRQ
jgi:hypothetical protein